MNCLYHRPLPRSSGHFPEAPREIPFELLYTGGQRDEYIPTMPGLLGHLKMHPILQDQLEDLIRKNILAVDDFEERVVSLLRGLSERQIYGAISAFSKVNLHFI